MRNKRNGRPRRVRRGNSLSLGTVPVPGCHFYLTAHTSPPDVDFRISLVYYLGDGIGTLIPFKVCSLRLHTLSPSMLPLPKTLLEGFFWYGVHLRRRVLHYLFSTLKTGSFHCLQFRKQPEVARSHVWRVGRLVNDWNFMFRQEILDQVRWMCWSIVMMHLPFFRRLEV